MVDKPKAFVLIPFDEDFTAIWDHMLRPDLEAAGFVAERADSRLDQQNILRDIVRGIAEADLIVADLTGLNPNVFYELGIAHGLEIPTILISQLVDEVPFDLRSYRVHEYSTHFKEVESFRQKFRDIAESHRSGRVAFGSPVKDFLGTTGRRRAEPRSVETELEKNEEPSEETEAGFLDFLMTIGKSSEKLMTSFDGIASATEEVGKLVAARTTRLGELQASGHTNAPKLMYLTVQQAAGDLNQYAGALEKQLPELEAVAEEMVQGFSGYVEWFANSAVDDREQIEQLRDSLREMLLSAGETAASLHDYRESIQSLQGASRPLTAASRRAASAVVRIVSVLKEFEAFATRAVSLIDAALIRASGKA